MGDLLKNYFNQRAEPAVRSITPKGLSTDTKTGRVCGGNSEDSRMKRRQDQLNPTHFFCVQKHREKSWLVPEKETLLNRTANDGGDKPAIGDPEILSRRRGWSPVSKLSGTPIGIYLG